MTKVRILRGYRSAATNEQYLSRGVYDLVMFPYPEILIQLIEDGYAVAGNENELEFIRYYYDHYTQKQLKSMLEGLLIHDYQIQRVNVDYVSKMDYILALKSRFEEIEQKDMNLC